MKPTTWSSLLIAAVLSVHSLAADESPRVMTVDFAFDKATYTPASSLAIRIDVRNTGNRPISLPPMIGLNTKTIRAYVRRAGENGKWLPFFQPQIATQILDAGPNPTLDPLRTISFYEVFPLWELPPEILFAKANMRLEIYIAVSFTDGVNAQSAPQNLQLKRLPVADQERFDMVSAELTPYVLLQPNWMDAFPPEAKELKDLPENPYLGDWLEAVSRVDHLCQSNVERDREIRLVLQHLDRLPQITRETIGVKIGYNVADYLSQRVRNRQYEKDEALRLLGLGLDALAVSRSNCQEVRGYRSILESTREQILLHSQAAEN
jgi:hypothetical protein